MKYASFALVCWTWLAAHAAVPPAGNLFPRDTLGLVTIPDWNTARTQFQMGSFGRIWADPAMKPFRDKVEAGFQEHVLGDLEKQLGVKSADYLGLLQGQISVGIIENGWNPSDEKSEPALVIVLDTKDKSAELKSRLVEVRKKLADAKKPMKTERIRDLEFVTVDIESKPDTTSPKAKGGKEDDADEDEKKPDGGKSVARTQHWTFGQVDTALVVGDSVNAVEKVVAILTGGTLVPVGELSEFQSCARATDFKNANLYGWVNASALTQLMKKGTSGAAGTGPMGLDPAKLISSSGLEGLNTVGFAGFASADGEQSRFTAVLPEGRRAGLFKLIEFEAKDASPPAFVPGDAISFRRWRLNGKKTWENLEALIQQVSPQLGGLVQISVSTLGKDKDPNFDFRAAFVANLGDDFITYQKAPRERTLAAIEEAPSLSLIGTADPAALVLGFRAAASLSPSAGEGLKERDFNGRHIYGVKLPGKDGGDDGKLLEFAAGNGYVAVSTDPSILEQYLRSGDGESKSLKDNVGMIEAAQKIGGMGSGLFGFQDAKEGTRIWWEVVRQSGGLDKLGLMPSDPQGAKKSADWIDVKLLPPFEAISKYLGLSVFSGRWESFGLNFQGYWPNPK